MGKLLHSLPKSIDPNLLVGFETSDDAGVYRLSDELALVQTVDFFTPIVDDPFVFGQIAAANAFSDVYAMGGKPLTALNISAFPKNFPLTILEEILKGGHTKAEEAGAVIVGGHTVEDSELKYGMAVTGTIHPKYIYTNRGAREGDVLILTKPLGTGILTTAVKKKKCSTNIAEDICHWMAYLNKSAAELLPHFSVHACTDITGFGLAGHSYQLAKASHVTLLFDTKYLPHYAEALYFAKQGCLTRADKTNRTYVGQFVEFQKKCTPEWQALIFDAQTSGGLLISVKKEDGYPLLKALHDKGLTESRIIGSVVASAIPKIIFT